MHKYKKVYNQMIMDQVVVNVICLYYLWYHKSGIMNNTEMYTNKHIKIMCTVVLNNIPLKLDDKRAGIITMCRVSVRLWHKNILYH